MPFSLTHCHFVDKFGHAQEAREKVADGRPGSIVDNQQETVL